MKISNVGNTHAVLFTLVFTSLSWVEEPLSQMIDMAHCCCHLQNGVVCSN